MEPNQTVIVKAKHIHLNNKYISLKSGVIDYWLEKNNMFRILGSFNYK